MDTEGYNSNSSLPHGGCIDDIGNDDGRIGPTSRPIPELRGSGKSVPVVVGGRST